MTRCRIEDHGTRVELWSPELAPGDQGWTYAMKILKALTPVARPWAVEVELGEWDPDLGMEPSGEAIWMARPDIPKGVTQKPNLQHDEPPQALSGSTAETILRLVPQPWFAIRFLVTAGRLHDDDASQVELEDLSGHSAPVVHEDRVRWVVGPVDAPGHEYAPPLTVEIGHDLGAIRVEVEGRWSWWSDQNRPEHQGLKAFETELVRSGFRRLVEE